MCHGDDVLDRSACQVLPGLNLCCQQLLHAAYRNLAACSTTMTCRFYKISIVSCGKPSLPALALYKRLGTRTWVEYARSPR